MFAYATSQSTEVSNSCARAPVGNASSPAKTTPIVTAIAIDTGFIVSPPPLPLEGGIELLRVLHPLQHEIGGRKARDDPRRCADNRVEVRVVPGVREAHERNRREDHCAHAPAGLTKCLVVFSTP